VFPGCLGVVSFGQHRQPRQQELQVEKENERKKRKIRERVEYRRVKDKKR